MKKSLLVTSFCLIFSVAFSFIGCSGNSDGGSATLTLRVEPKTYSVTNLSVVPASAPDVNNLKFRSLEGCTADSEAERCPYEHFDLAKVRCQVYVGSQVLGLSARAKEDTSVSVSGSYSGCVDRVICGFVRVQPDGSYGLVDLDAVSTSISVDGFEGGCGELGTISCRSERTGCDQDGFGCSYSLVCSKGI